MIAARVVDALADTVALVIADASCATESVIADVHAARTDERDSVLLLIAGDVSVLDRAILRAAIGPLAIALAPSKRVNAVDVVGDAAEDDVVAAARFLAAAASTTGQILDVRG
ncbi:MAG: hypothetical protein JWM65_1155 [Sphingomonas bacterium]|nr:hypothetical protein [Sphingomonas bacterium]